jgi:squalene synthase HpnC
MNLAGELQRFGPRAPPRIVSEAEARSYCRRLAEAHYENFTVVSWLFPRRLHQHLCNVYAYCRWADDLADEQVAGYQRTELLTWWGAALDALYAGQTRHPVFVALAETVQEFKLPQQPLADLLVAFRRDQVQTRYETVDDLLTYCEKSANPVGRIVLRLGDSYSEENARLSDSICTGLQLANFWQDVQRDYERGRVYIPQENCRRAGWDEGRFAAGRFDRSFADMMAPLVEQTEERFRLGEPLIGRVNGDLRLPVRLFVAGGRAVLAAIRRSGYDVWSRRPTVGRLTKLRLLAAALLTSKTRCGG